jgi:hypothetical protein
MRAGEVFERRDDDGTRKAASRSEIASAEIAPDGGALLTCR